MSDMRDVLAENASRLFSDICTPAAFADAEKELWQPAIWNALEENGFTQATRSTPRGGSGCDLGDALAIVREAGACCLPAPLSESLIAELALSAAGLAPCAGVTTMGPVSLNERCLLTRDSGKWKLSANLRRIPWARCASSIVLLTEFNNTPATIIAKLPKNMIHDRNYAHEPRDTVHFDDIFLPEDAVSQGEMGLCAMDIRFYGALFRLVAMTGTLGKILDMTIEYALQRQQFGRTISKFQAVQQQIAVMASQVAAANAATDATIEAIRLGPAHFEIAAAKSRINEAAGIAVGIAHQIHGAMGFTFDHPLHRYTRRLWAWRDEFGTEHEWSTWLGEAVIKLGSAGLWPFLSSDPKVLPH